MKKKELIIILGSLLVVVLSVSIAYFSTTINSKNSNVSTSSAELKIVFASGSGTIAGSEIEPGWSSGVNTFTVKNQSNGTYKYNIVIKDLINTFVTTGYLQYKITSTDGGYNMSDFKDVPKSSISTDMTLGYNIKIEKNKTHTYNVEFRYLNSETENQNIDMGKELSGTLYIDNNEIKLHGDYKEGTLGYKILEDNPVRGVRSDFTKSFNSTNTGVLYTSTESIVESAPETVYYFAGNAKNNWVKFGGFYWRIIRTNHDGSVRLLYVGTSTDTTSGYIGKSAFNTEYNDSMYVGYMYGTSGSLENNRTNENSSLVKQYIDNWYDGTRTIVDSSKQTAYTDTSTNKLIDYSEYLSQDAVYCNDREIGRGTYTATGSSVFDYDTYIRLFKSPMSPSYNCTNSKDAFSLNNSEAKLTYPIGLMTADEVAFAGGHTYISLFSPYVWFNLNSKNEFISKDTVWWTISPGGYYNSNNNNYYAAVFRVNYYTIQGGEYDKSYEGVLLLNSTTYVRAIRPVISLKSNVIWSRGDGSPENPYEIVYN